MLSPAYTTRWSPLHNLYPINIFRIPYGYTKDTPKTPIEHTIDTHA
ncbi:TPA: hypothetical protein ACO354_003514 [Salmonella enterica subsp. enterica serovar Strathcona]|nr:hypothetical protein [Salmonella enterica subsp. enterica serovar Coeln]